MKILVLGSAGQIGSSVCKYLKKNNHEFVCWDIVDSEKQDLRVYNEDLVNCMRDVDFVYYFASDVGGAKYLDKYQDSYQFITNNIKIMSNVFDSLEKTKKPFIFTSSQMADIPESTYGFLKILGEKITSKLNGITVRLWNVYGKEHDEEKFHVITDFIKMAKTNGVINLRTDGKESRQFLSAEDFCECLWLLTNQYDSLDRDKNYHISSFEWITILDIANIVSQISGCEIKTSNNKDNTQMNRMNEPDKYVLTFWQPKTPIFDGIKKLYDEYEV